MTDEQPTREPLTTDQIEMYRAIARSVATANQTEETQTYAYPVPIDVLVQLTEELLEYRNRPPVPIIDVSFAFNWNDVASGENLDRVLDEIKTRLAGVEDTYVMTPPSFEDAEVGIWNYETVYAALRYLADYNPMLLQNLACKADDEGNNLWHTMWDGEFIGVDREIALTIIKAAGWAEANGDPAKGGVVKLRDLTMGDHHALAMAMGYDPAAPGGSSPVVFTVDGYGKPKSANPPSDFRQDLEELFGGEEPKKIDPDSFSGFAPPSDTDAYHE